MIFESFRMKPNGVPILQKAEIEILAEKYILDFNPEAARTPMEIDIDSFIQNYLRLEQDFQYLSHNGLYLGMMVFNDTDRVPVYVPETKSAEYISARAGTVIIDNSLLEAGMEHRYRYTMGHEGGHAVLHKWYFSNTLEQLSTRDGLGTIVQCRAVPSGGKAKPVPQWDDLDRMEWQANYFSAALLMPKAMVLKLIGSIKNCGLKIRDVKYVQEVVNTFNVSWQAAANRLRCLGIIKEEIPVESAALDFAY